MDTTMYCIFAAHIKHCLFVHVLYPVHSALFACDLLLMKFFQTNVLLYLLFLYGINICCCCCSCV